MDKATGSLGGICQCEHASHFEASTSTMIDHAYGFRAKLVGPIQTPYGKFVVCEHCRFVGHMRG